MPKYSWSRFLSDISGLWDDSIVPVIRWVYIHSGFQFVFHKFAGKPIQGSSRREPPSGVLWLIGIYFAAYGFAYQQYSRSIEFENLLQMAYEPVPAAMENKLCGFMWEYETIVTDVPFEPDWRSPASVWWSLFADKVPSTDPSLLRPRELEEIARIIMFSGRTSYLEELGRVDELADDEGLTLSEPYHQESVVIIESEKVVYIELAPRGEHEALAKALTGDELSLACFRKLQGEPENPDDSIMRNACADAIFSRACQETRSKLTDATPEQVRQSVIDRVALPDDFELKVRHTYDPLLEESQ